MSFNEEKLAEIKETFQMLDRNNEGSFNVKQLELAMKSVGLNPSKKELSDMFDEADTTKKGRVEFHEFLEVISSKMKDTDPEDELRECFMRLLKDPANTKLDVSDFSKFMTSYGQRLTRGEMDEFIQSVQVDSQGRVDLEDFIKVLTK